MSKDLKFSTDARAGLKRGIDKLANMVKVTLGAKGRFVTIEKQGRLPHTTKDGVTVAKEIFLSDPLENMGAQMVKGVSKKTADDAGDGTTTATVLAQAMVEQGIKNIAAGANPMDLKRGMDKAVEAVVENLQTMADPIQTNDEITSVATISANNDEVIGKLIGEAMAKVTADGTITVEQSKDMTTYVDLIEGIKYHRGYTSPAFVTNPKKQEAVLEDVFIFMTPNKIENVQQILPVLTQLPQNASLLIIGGEISGEANATLAINKLKQGFKVAAIKAPFLSAKMKYTMEDLAVFTGGTVVSEEKGLNFEDFEPHMFGRAAKVIIDQESTAIIGGHGDPETIEQRKEAIRAQIEKAIQKLDIEELEERLARLAGAVAVVYVGGNSDVEIKEKIDRIDDAIGATKAANAEGIVIGGGVALLHCQGAIDSLIKGLNNQDQITGANLVKKAIEAPFRQIMLNAGEEPSVIMSAVMSEDYGIGYDVKNENYEDFFEVGIIDPKKVTRVAIENASSIASMVLMTEGTITDEV